VPDRRTIATLNAQLWSLRSEVESQGRNMTRVHRELDSLPPIGDPRRVEEIERILADLEQVLDANRTIRALCEISILEARTLATFEKDRIQAETAGTDG
jgi:hypothetical protein